MIRFWLQVGPERGRSPSDGPTCSHPLDAGEDGNRMDFMTPLCQLVLPTDSSGPADTSELA